MNRYLNFNSIKGLGYQTIARNAHNQTFVFQPVTWAVAPGYGKSRIDTRFKSDLNYQLAVL